jgi:1-acyl-sn-glycerol-3-phosphate acyltransferase
MFDLKVWGTENVPKDGPCLLLANHQSFLDPVIVAVKLKRPVSYMAKSELFVNRYFGWLIRSLHAFPVKQGAADITAIKLAISKLHEGNVLNVYPEGSRTWDGEIGPIFKGVALIVRRAQVPIIPVVLDGTYNAWPRRSKYMQRWPVRVEYGPPLQTKGLDGDEIVALIDKTFREMLIDVREKSRKLGHPWK